MKSTSSKQLTQTKQAKGKKSMNNIKIRKSWGDVKPFTRVHTTPKGKKGYDRRENKKIERNY